MRTPCIDVNSYKLQMAIEEGREKRADKASESSALVAPGSSTISQAAVDESERGLTILLNEQRQKNIQNRLYLEDKAWNVIKKLLDSLDSIEQGDLLESMASQTGPRSVSAIEKLVKVFNTLLKNVSLEDGIVGVEATPLSLLDDAQLDELIARSDDKTIEEIKEPPEMIVAEEVEFEKDGEDEDLY